MYVIDPGVDGKKYGKKNECKYTKDKNKCC